MNSPTSLNPQPRRGSEQTLDGRSIAMPAGYEKREPGINFAQAVPANGYLWWYVDAISDDGTQALTMIIFVGSVFSPYYARARRRGNAEAQNYCAFNTILYGPGHRKYWSMTERGADKFRCVPDRYSLGPSTVVWDGNQLNAQIDERCVPLLRRMRGEVRVTPAVMTEHSLLLDEPGRHRWHPLAPIARVDVDFPSLGVSWSGNGYLDSNEGNEPLADGFRGWDWTRTHLPNGDCVVRYETRPHLQQPGRLALRFRADGSMVSEATSCADTLPSTTVWRMPRRMPGADGAMRLVRTLEDTPFYARSLVGAASEDVPGTGFHESLSMERFQQRWVQSLLPFRMPRVT